LFAEPNLFHSFSFGQARQSIVTHRCLLVPVLRFIIHDESDNSWGAERVEAGNGGKSTNRTSKVKLLALIFIFLTLAIIILSGYFYYLPLKDVEVRVEETHWGTEVGDEYIAFRLNVTNKGTMTHTVRFVARVVFDSEPGIVITQWAGEREIPPSDWHLLWPPTLVFVPGELLETPYEASCSVTLTHFVNEDNEPWIVLGGVVWLVALAAILTSLVRSWRQTR